MEILSIALFIGLLLLILRRVYRRFWCARLGARLWFSAAEAFEGESLELVEELSNAKMLPLPWVAVGFQVSRNLIFVGQANRQISDDYYQSDLFSVNMYQRITRRLPFVCGRRGFYPIKRLSLSCSSPLFTDKLVAELPCEQTLTVFPKLIGAPDLEVVFEQIQGDVEVRRFTNLDPFAFQGIREYQPLDEFRAINFKATAKTGRLMTNINGATASQEVVILLNLESYSEWMTEDVFEEGIRLAASLAERCLLCGMTVAMESNGRDAVTGSPLRLLAGSGESHLREMLHRLARVDLSQEREPMSAALDDIRNPGPVYLLISSYCGRDLQEAVLALRQRGLSARWLIPAFADAELPLEETRWITRWEVKPYDAPTNLYQKSVG